MREVTVSLTYLEAAIARSTEVLGLRAEHELVNCPLAAFAGDGEVGIVARQPHAWR